MLKLSNDLHGREAFAYLAVTLLVLTTFYVSYQVSMEREWEHGSRKASVLSDMTIKMDTLKRSLSNEIVSLHDQIMLIAEKEVLIDSADGRLDGSVEGLLIDRLTLELEDLLASNLPTDTGFMIDLVNWSVDSRPIFGGVEMPVPGTGSNRDLSGLNGLCQVNEILGVNTTVHIDLLFRDVPGYVEVYDELDIKVTRLSLAEFAKGRLDRLDDAFQGPELISLVEYMVSSLAQMKCMMGYGREPGTGEITPITLITDGELLGILDLAIALLSESYLRSRDEDIIMGIGSLFASAPGANGDPLIQRILENTTTSIDPGLLTILSEGIFHNDNPPSLQTMLRPLFQSMVDLLVNRIVSYVGLEDEMLMTVGGLKALFDLGVEAADSLSNSIFGLDLIDSSRETARSIFSALMERSPLLELLEETIMIRTCEDAIWNGSSISGYTMIELPEIERSYEMGLSDGGPENHFYRSRNGSIHSGVEYYDPSEDLVGLKCDIYRISARFEFDPIEPPFQSRDLLSDDEFINALAYFLGTDESNTGSWTEGEFQEKGRFAIRKVTEELFGIMSGSGSEIWDQKWRGWDINDIPSMVSSLPSLSSMMDLDTWPLMELAEMFTTGLLEEFNAIDLLDSLREVENEYSILISDWISVNYDKWSHKNDQLIWCSENKTSMIFGNSTVNILEVVEIDEGQIYDDYYLESGRDNISIFYEYPELSKLIGLGLADKIPIDGGLDMHWNSEVSSSFAGVREREFGLGMDGSGEGWIRRELSTPNTRGFDLTFSSYNGDRISMAEEVESILKRGLDTIGDSFQIDTSISGSRFMIPSPIEMGSINVSGSDWKGPPIEKIETCLNIDRAPDLITYIRSLDGRYNTDPLNGSAPYETSYRVAFIGEYQISYNVSDKFGMTTAITTRTYSIDLNTDIEIRSHWPMFGVDYENFGTLAEFIVDSALEARDTLKNELNGLVEDILGGSMSSLREIPPIMIDIVKGSDLDPVEIARVVSNVTMELSSTLRDTVKDVIREVMEMGIRGVLNATCNILGIDEIDLNLDLGTFKAALHTERKALMGGEGNLLNITMDILPVGMHCFMSFNRLDKGDFDFNGTVTFDIGPLFIRMELDPFMMRAPHMISIEVRYETSSGRVLRASFECPALEEYRSCQISLGDTLGIEPFIPIPPLGIQAVIDAGFRLNYRMPEELPPHLNEVFISRMNISWLEIFNPRDYPLYGSSISMEEPENGPFASWRLEPQRGRFVIVGMNSTNLWSWKDRIPTGGNVRIVLRSPSGQVWDDIEVDLHQKGWLSREADGFGVWRYGNGTPGGPNGGSLPTDIRSLLISIALTSLKEAWAEAYEVHGLTFDVVVPFLQKAIDLFMERFLSLVRELVIDVRLFLSIEIEDASGSAGGGLEVSFQADGEAVAEFLGWLYENIKVFVENLADPKNAGDYRAFPWEILTRCYIGLDLFMEVEMPGPVAKMAPQGVDLPDSFTLAIMGKVNLALPMKLLGKDVGGMYIGLGVYIKDAPDSIVSLFYDIGNIGLTQDFYLLRAGIWEESIEMV